MRSRLSPEHQRALDHLRAVAEGTAARPDSDEARQQLAQALGAVFLGAVAEGLRAAAAPPAAAAAPAPAPAPPAQAAQLHHRLLLQVEAAEAAGAKPAQVVDELCWALASYAMTRDLNPKSVRGTLATVQGLLARSGPLA